jgi:tetratricopeptide (TPR) repeat protein
MRNRNKKPFCSFHLLRSYLLALVSLVLMTAVFPVQAPGADLSKARIEELFEKANALYHQADQAAATNPEKAKFLYQQAAMRYESIVEKGKIHNGKLYYNIGNAYFRTGDIGRAILNYRRALQYIPNDANLRQNLSYARNRRLDKIDEPQDTRVFKTLFFWHYDLSTPTRILLFSIFFAAIWIFAMIRRLVRKAFLNWALAISLALTVVMAGSLTAEAITLYRVTPGVIIDPSVVARKGNSDAYAPSFNEPLHAGTEFVLIEKRDDWYYVRLADERTCWVRGKSVGLVR